ncbi:tyrosine recombinase XerC [Deinococcus xinjiangensis]|uniref:Tyrosine recombinase XerC n=1 Tax=Deinococcus xinjiangensis TaxID=457454 RepID=A0ABP9VEE5_9DEIO
MRRRANEGTVHPVQYKGKVVSWRGLATYTDPNTLTRHRKSVSRRTKEEAEEALLALIRKLPKSSVKRTPRTAKKAVFPLSKSPDTMHALFSRWIDFKRRDIRPSTYRNYVHALKLALPHIGEKHFKELTVLDVEALVSAIYQERGPKTAGRVLRVVGMALRQAVRWQMIPGNVAEAVRAPRFQKREMQVWNPEQIERFLKVAKLHRLYPLFALALSTGMRKGELLSLQWQDVDLESRVLMVRRNLVKNEAGQYELGLPKTETGTRRIILATDTVEALHKHWQEEIHGKRTPKPGDFVFTAASGNHIMHRHLDRVFKELTEKARLPRIRFHDLRHTSASLLIRHGVSPKIVADRMGHADVRFTLQVYTHVYDDQREEAAVPLTELLGVRRVADGNETLASGSLEALRELHATLGRFLSSCQPRQNQRDSDVLTLN